jgi:hypothetical protein
MFKEIELRCTGGFDGIGVLRIDPRRGLHLRVVIIVDTTAVVWRRLAAILLVAALVVPARRHSVDPKKRNRN